MTRLTVFTKLVKYVVEDSFADLEAIYGDRSPIWLALKCRLKRVSQRLPASQSLFSGTAASLVLEGLRDVYSHRVLRRRNDGLVEEADERAGAEGNRPRSGRAAALLGLRQLRRLRDDEARSPWKAAGAGVGAKPKPAQAAVPLDHRVFVDLASERSMANR